MDGEVLPALERLEAKDWALNRALIEKCGALGLLGTNVPESYGGVDLDKVSTMLVSEQMARSASFAATFGAQANLTILPIYMFGTEAQKPQLPAQAGRRGDGRRLLPQRIRLRVGCARRQGPGDAPGRRQLPAVGREDVDHQRRLRRPLRGLRQGRRRALHRLPGRARLARGVGGQGGAQARPARLLDHAGDPAGGEGAGRRRARRGRQGPQGRLQRPQLRPLQARRDDPRRHPGDAGRGGRATRPRASSSACRSPPSAPSATSSARWPPAPTPSRA